ncbi:hypothetical protein GCM10027610_067770 [Dactylosporangium cerinum]
MAPAANAERRARWRPGRAAPDSLEEDKRCSFGWSAGGMGRVGMPGTNEGATGTMTGG